MCLLEVHSDREPTATSGADLLRRAKHVFRAIDLGHGFPYPDCETAELEGHFLQVGDIILPATFFEDAPGDTGNFWASKPIEQAERFRSYSPTWRDVVPDLFLGLEIEETTGTGQIITSRTPAATEEMVRAFPSVDGHRGVRGAWWRLRAEPEPVWNGAELVHEIERLSDARNVLDFFADRLLKGTVNDCIVGLRFPGRDGLAEWLVVIVRLAERPPKATPEKDMHDAMRECVRAAPVALLRCHRAPAPVASGEKHWPRP